MTLCLIFGGLSVRSTCRQCRGRGRRLGALGIGVGEADVAGYVHDYGLNINGVVVTFVVFVVLTGSRCVRSCRTHRLRITVFKLFRVGGLVGHLRSSPVFVGIWDPCLDKHRNCR